MFYGTILFTLSLGFFTVVFSSNSFYLTLVFSFQTWQMQKLFELIFWAFVYYDEYKLYLACPILLTAKTVSFNSTTEQELQ